MRVAHRDEDFVLNKCLLECNWAGPFAWLIGESGQVGNEAATAVPGQCRSQARLFAPGDVGRSS